MITAGRSIFLLAIAIATVVAIEPSALADDPCQNPLTHQACASASDGSIRVDASRQRAAPGASPTRPTVNSWAAMAGAYCNDASTNAYAGQGASTAVTDICRGFIATPAGPGQVDAVRAFRELPLYRGEIRTEPYRWTLVHFETSFWCGTADGTSCETLGEGERTVTLLGQPVRIRPKIIGYSWSFGDGTTTEVTDRATHTYKHAGTRTVTLTITWTADYAIGTAAYQPIDDTTTTTSPPRLLPVREAQTVIVEG